MHCSLHGIYLNNGGIKMTVKEIRDKVRIHIDESTSNSESLTDAQINSLIADATEEVASLFLTLDDSFYITDATFTILANIETYDLPTGFLRIKELRDDKKNPIFRLYEIGKRSNFLNIGHTVRYYFQHGKIGFLAIPSANATYPYKYIKAADVLALTANGDDLVTTWADNGSNVWKADLVTEPTYVFFDDVQGTKRASIAACTEANDWFWAASVLYVYSTTDPDTAYVDPGIKASVRTLDDVVPDVPAYLGHTLISIVAALLAMDMDEETSSYLINKKRDLERQIIDLYSQRNTDFPRMVESDPDLEL